MHENIKFLESFGYALGDALCRTRMVFKMLLKQEIIPFFCFEKNLSKEYVVVNTTVEFAETPYLHNVLKK